MFVLRRDLCAGKACAVITLFWSCVAAYIILAIYGVVKAAREAKHFYED